MPADRPVLELAVTLEPSHMAIAQFDPLPVTHMPVTVADAAEIENLVTITDTPSPDGCCSTAQPTKYALQASAETRLRGRPQAAGWRRSARFRQRDCNGSGST